MKAYVITTKDSDRLIDGEIRDYPTNLPECELFLGPTPSADNAPPDWFKVTRRGETVRAHAWCCYLSKIQCLEHHLTQYVDEDCLIFEDDVTFLPHFSPIFNRFIKLVPSNWAILWFNYATKVTAVEVVPLVLSSSDVWSSSALLFRSKYIPDIIKDLKKSYNSCDCEIDRILSKLSYKYASYLPLYSVCGQRAGYSYIQRTDVYRSLFTATKYKALDGTIKYSAEDDYKLYLQ